MQHGKCNCGAIILPYSKQCRPCHFKLRKSANKGMMDFVCMNCNETYQRKDRGKVYNAGRLFCSNNCRGAMMSVCKEIDPNKRYIYTTARHRARSYLSKTGMTATMAPKLFEVLVKLYIAKGEINEGK